MKKGNYGAKRSGKVLIVDWDGIEKYIFTLFDHENLFLHFLSSSWERNRGNFL